MNRAHHIDFYAGVQTELLRDPRHFRRRHHDADRKQDVVRHGEKPKEKQCRLQKCRKAKRDDLFDPLDKAICVASWDAEHVQTSHGDLDEQDPAPLEIGEEHLDHRIGHEDDAEDDHNGTGDDTQAKVARGARHLCDPLHSIEVLNDLLAHRSNTGPKAGEPGGKGPLYADGSRSPAVPA